MGFVGGLISAAIIFLYPAWRVFGQAGFPPGPSLVVLIPGGGLYLHNFSRLRALAGTARRPGQGRRVMGVSIWQIIIVLVFVAVAIWLLVRILHRVGYSGWWVLLNFIPIVNIVLIWVFSFQSWPNGDRRMMPHGVALPPAAPPGEPS
jgi:hypothetical protein